MSTIGFRYKEQIQQLFKGVLSRSWYCFFVLGLVFNSIVAQTPLAVQPAQGRAGVAIDSSSVKIGAPLRYLVQVETAPGLLVVFPDGQNFTPLEMLDAFKIDTVKLEKTHTLSKQYVLTQFDSGHYYIPSQKIRIGDQTITTDSVAVEFRDVVVDTAKQKMYDIKPLIAVDADKSGNWKKYLWWVLGILAAIGLTLFLIFKKRKPKPIPEHEMPPYERAMMALQRIDSNDYLAKEAYKEYYSQLSDTARLYLNGEILDHAMESTTDELIHGLLEKQAAGFVTMDKQVIAEFKKVLETADLAKFAKTKPDIGTARADRETIASFIEKVKVGLPEPTEEELLQNETYRLEQAAKQRKKKLIFAVVSILGILLLATLIFIGLKGVDYVKDNVLGHPTKDLVKSDWIRSAYGSPPVTISTPIVLKRANVQVPEEVAGQVTMQTFVYGSLASDFGIVLNTTKIPDGVELDLEQAVEGSIKMIEQNGAKNMVTKSEPFETLGGVEGLKTFGTGEFPVLNTENHRKGQYIVLVFVENGGLQQVLIKWQENDRYAKEIVDRIVNSVELKMEKE